MHKLKNALLFAFVVAAAAVPAGDATSVGTCANQIKGTDGNDLLNGTPLSDQMLGLPGNDTMSGASAADCLDGGPGGDRLVGGEGGDRILGGSDGDSINGGNGIDALDGQDGSDALAGEAGDDVIHGGPGDDDVHEVGDGYRAGQPLDVGSNKIDTGSGKDTVLAANGRKDVINCGGGSDRASVDRADRLKSCEKLSFPASPLPGVSPKSGNRRKSFMVGFRSLANTNRNKEFFSITVKGPSSCKRIVSNSIGVGYHRNRVVRYQLRPFSGNGRAAKRWCRGGYRGAVEFVSVPSATCKPKVDQPPPDCTERRSIGEFGFRVR